MLSAKKILIKRNPFFEKSTKTFKNFILNYQKNENKNNINNRQLLLNDIESRLQIAKNEEKDNEYIINEVRKNIKFKNNLLNSFGKNALNHYSYDEPNNNIKIKLDKTKLFNPLFEYNSNISKYSGNKKNSKKYNSFKIIKFPKIINSNSKINWNHLKPIYLIIVFLI